MGFFGMFKKKDDFDSMIKDPLTDPFGSMPTSINTPSIGSMNGFQRNDLPNFENSQTHINDETALGGFDNNTNSNDNFSNPFGTSASAVSTNTSQYATPPPLFRTQNNSMNARGSGKTEPEVYEEMPIQNKQSNSKSNESFDKRDMELLNSKLDNIKTQLENINHRLDNIERGTNDTQNRRRYAW